MTNSLKSRGVNNEEIGINLLQLMKKLSPNVLRNGGVIR